MPLSFSTLRLEVLDANADAMALLAEGNLDESRAHLDDAAELLLRARKRIDLSSSVSETLSVSNASNEDEGGAAVPFEGTGGETIGELASITNNNLASWWRASGDLGLALEALSRALQEGEEWGGGISARQLAFTHSNLCAVLSQVTQALWPKPGSL